MCAVCSVMSHDSLGSHGLKPTRLLCSWNSLGKKTGVGCHFLLQGIFLTQGSKTHFLNLLYWQADSFTTEPLGSLKRKDRMVKNTSIGKRQDTAPSYRKITQGVLASPLITTTLYNHMSPLKWWRQWTLLQLPSFLAYLNPKTLSTMSSIKLNHAKQDFPEGIALLRAPNSTAISSSLEREGIRRNFCLHSIYDGSKVEQKPTHIHLILWPF